MKKIALFAFAMLLVLSGVQAQIKKSTKSSSGQVTSSIGGATVLAGESIILPEPSAGLDTPLLEALKNRQSIRKFSEVEVPQELLASLLWSAYGFNRHDQQKRVVPSAINCQEYDLYLFTREGVYLYDAGKNCLNMVLSGDSRSLISQQKFFAVAPLSIVLVANYSRMSKFKDVESRDFYAAVDCGYISQNIYLFCSSASLNTVACGGIDRDAIHKLLGIKNGRAMLAHPVSLK